MKNDRLENQRAALQEVLALYALTQRDVIAGNGTLDDIPVVNGDEVRSALFGSGMPLDGMIPALHLGGTGDKTTYLDMREILSRVGIFATNVATYHNHAHIYMHPSDPVGIDPGSINIVTNSKENGETPNPAAEETSSLPGTQTLLDYTKMLMTGEELMFTIDVPYIPPQTDTIELVQAENTASQSEYLLKSCDEVSMGGVGIVSPAGWLVSAILEQSGRKAPTQGAPLDSKVKLTQINDYEHGEIVPQITEKGVMYYEYYTEPGYLGKDTAIFLAEFEGKVYKIQANVIVSKGVDDNHPQCPEPEMIKIDKPLSDNTETVQNFVST